MLVNQQMPLCCSITCLQSVHINPLTSGAFCQKSIFSTFWRSSAWKWAKLALIYSKRLLQHDSTTFFTLASCFMTFLLGHGYKSKVTFVVSVLFFFFFYLSFFSFSYFFFAAVFELLLGLLPVQKFLRKHY